MKQHNKNTSGEQAKNKHKEHGNLPTRSNGAQGHQPITRNEEET